MKLALIGNGAIAHQIISYCQGTDGRIDIVQILDQALSQEPGGPPVTTQLPALLAAKPDLVVECAGHAAVAQHGSRVLEAGLDLVVVSVGSLADAGLREPLFAAARRGPGRLTLTTGAVAGLDGLMAAKIGGLDSVTLRSRKPPLSWGGAPGVEGIDLAAITAPTAIFEGSAGEAALAFPKNANVAATVALAGLGFEATNVVLMADPAARRNIHEVTAEGAFGCFTITLENVPSPDNPKTSALTAMSIIRLIEARAAPILIA